MQPFPVISSIVSAEHIGFFVQQTYGLPAGATCQLLKTGINHTYLITSGKGKFVFRLYSLNWRSKEEIGEEIKLLNVLKDAGVSVSCPIADSSNNYINEILAPEGLRYAVLFSFAEGDKALNFSPELHYKVGETMAQIHHLTQDLNLQRVTYTPEVILQEPVKLFGKFLPAESEEMQWMLSAQKYLLNAIAGADDAQMRKGAVHMDIWFDNMNITPKGAVTIFDFDFCGNGWLAYDIAYYILQLHSTEKDVAERELKKESFLAGYESIMPISAEEKRMLPVLGLSMYLFYLGIQAQRFDNWSNVFFNEIYLKRFITLLVRKFFEENVSSESIDVL
ncbi:phosphotransferase enzyme family protein [Mucilaginibacter pedocola]|uniref:Aminoglycoside phosphotransferase n=1 Tax=Mucilaginibacter pedocola TaxID=1792845 RepID=A0A1S9PE00_9SPHI|nr:phosphotransferase [Mucilaginibacter pedocola]OOQ59175.1 aminoglycoside phosphotransferase [Mucilaginibacter pedocola]